MLLPVLLIYAATVLALRFAMRATRTLSIGLRVTILFGVLMAPGFAFWLLFGQPVR